MQKYQNLATYDPAVPNHIKSEVVFTGTPSIMQNNVIDILANFITDKIKSNWSNVAILFHEITVVTNKSVLLKIVRIVVSEGNCQA